MKPFKNRQLVTWTQDGKRKLGRFYYDDAYRGGMRIDGHSYNVVKHWADGPIVKTNLFKEVLIKLMS